MDMEPMGGTDLVLLMVLGVTVVVITLRAYARAERLKREESAKRTTGSRRRSTADDTPAAAGRRTR
ncbi:hypothetical protein ACQPXM_24520 [Kribbella sp. CA-253562]|uniref:hypothetical protein n=1 Tax=Kribbella sp. CA-253562 TaxID=3239942 RepID=UPI003D8A5089